MSQSLGRFRLSAVLFIAFMSSALVAAARAGEVYYCFKETESELVCGGCVGWPCNNPGPPCGSTMKCSSRTTGVTPVDEGQYLYFSEFITCWEIWECQWSPEVWLCVRSTWLVSSSVNGEPGFLLNGMCSQGNPG